MNQIQKNQIRIKNPNWLLFEHNKSPVNIIKEQSSLAKDKKSYFIEGIFVQAEDRNQNGRIYPFELVDPEIKIMQENIKQKFRCQGELDHPEYIEIRMQNCAHYLVDLKRDDGSKKYFYGKSKILDPDKFPNAGKVISYIEEGIKFGVSTRGIGDMDSNGIITEWQLITVDIVADPSAQSAMVEAIYENRDKFLKNNIINLEQYNSINKINKNNKHYKNIMENVDSFFNYLIKG